MIPVIIHCLLYSNECFPNKINIFVQGKIAGFRSYKINMPPVLLFLSLCVFAAFASLLYLFSVT